MTTQPLFDTGSGIIDTVGNGMLKMLYGVIGLLSSGSS